MKPFFSIIIPTLNEQEYIPQLLTDLENQTFKNFEVIVVDGNSEDKTLEQANRFKDKFQSFTTFISKKRQVCTQRNFGSKKAKADWIIFMDADNRIPHYFLQGIKYKIESLKPDILTTWVKEDTKNKKDQAIMTIANLFIEAQKNTKNPYVLEAMLCFNKHSFNNLNGFDESLAWGEGSDLLRRAVQRNMYFEVTRDPKYVYSLRRLRKQGTLKSARNVAVIELARLRNKTLPKEKATYLYPMEGGKYFDMLDKSSTTRIRDVVKKFYNITPISKVRKKAKRGILSHLINRNKSKSFFE